MDDDERREENKMIEFRNVSKTYDTGTKAVKNANFVIDKGEFAFLVHQEVENQH